MSAPGGAPSPAPRSGSMGPNGNGMPMSSQPPLSGTPVHPASTPGPPQPQSGAMSQQNLNQIGKHPRSSEIAPDLSALHQDLRSESGDPDYDPDQDRVSKRSKSKRATSRPRARQPRKSRPQAPPAHAVEPVIAPLTALPPASVPRPAPPSTNGPAPTAHAPNPDMFASSVDVPFDPGLDLRYRLCVAAATGDHNSTSAVMTDFMASRPEGAKTVIDYLAKKGYSRTEAMLRMESANQEIDGRPLPPLGEDARPKFKQGFDLLKAWVEENLDLYKPELRRVLWPLFVYSFINMVTSGYHQEAKQFFESNKNMFLPEHTDDIRVFEPISLPEHVQANSVANKYRSNKWRIILSNPAYTNLLQFLESKEKEGGSVMNAILSSYCVIKTVDRSADDRFSFATMLGQIGAGQTFPTEDEGIPGHHPGSAYTGDNPAMAGTLPRLRLGKLPMEQTLEEDVRAELGEEDVKEPPAAGRNTLVQEFDQMIKKEEDDEAPTRAEIPFPPSTARDVAMEVTKVKENRDRYRIEGRTGGVGPGVSVCMFTFHNTYDGINCMDFSDDNMLVAAGFEQSYIRVWSLDGKNIEAAYPDLDDMPPANSRRLIGHSGPVYAVAFQPCATRAENASGDDYVPTNARFLLSSSADKTIRLWSLDTWTCMVVYKGHDRPVWDLRWGPFGHYFVSSGSDRTARLWVTDHIRQQRIFVGHDQDVDCVCFHPNSAYIFTASSDHTVRMWAVTTGNAVRMFTGHTGNITAMECSRDGKILASADDQGSISLWDLAPGRLLKRMRGHGKGGIWSLSWSVESTVLVSGGADGTVRVWDVTGPQDSSQGRVISDGTGATKLDASNPTTAAAGQNKKKKGKDVVVTPDQISAFATKKSPVYKVKFTNMNLVVAGGAYLP